MSNTAFAFPPADICALPIAGSDHLFPVHRIYCIGRNYGKHVQEMGGDPREQPPIFFMKPADAATGQAQPVPYPLGTNNFHHEIELVVALKSGGENLQQSQATSLIYGFAAGVDLTRRDLQNEAKASGQPWDSAKGFDASAPIGLIHPFDACGPLTGEIALSVNGEIRQKGRLTDMIWDVPAIISAVSSLWRLEPGDLIFTGTPDGVGPLARGDEVFGQIEGVGVVSFRVS